MSFWFFFNILESVVSFLKLWLAVFYKFLEKQEYIPVGCVPPARYRMGVFMTETPLLDRDPPGQKLPWTITQWTETFLDRDLPGQKPPWTITLWTETFLDRNSPRQLPNGQRPSWTETFLDRNHPGQLPYGQRPPWTEMSWTEIPGKRPRAPVPHPPWTDKHLWKHKPR